MKTKIILGSILLLGLFLRALFITKLPLYGDELTMVYDTYSILKTGHDQLGNFLPITFKMGAGRPGGYIYFSLPFVAIFGPTAMGVRSLSILSGLGIIVLLYLLGKRFFNEKVGLAAALVAALSPWELSLSRGGFETNFALFLSLMGVYFFVNASKKGINYLWWVLTWGLAIHTYPTYKLVLPLFLIPLIWFVGGPKEIFQKKNTKFLIFSGIVGVFFIGLALDQTFFGGSEQRFLSINAFSQNNLQQQIIQKVNFQRNISELPQAFTKFIYNKPIEYFINLRNAYLDNFSMNYLFISGDGNPTHNMTGIGEMYVVDIILVLVGMLGIYTKHKKIFGLLIVWLLIAPLATTLLLTPHALRNSFMIPPLLLFSSFGLISLYDARKSLFGKFVLVLVIISWFAQFVFLFSRLYFLSPNQYSNFWSYPAKLATDTADKNIRNYDYIILSSRIDNVEYAYPVYTKIDPSLVIAQNIQKTNLGGYSFKKFGNVYIGSISQSDIFEFIKNLKGSVLFIGDYMNDREYLTGYQTLSSKDQTKALILEEKR